MPEHTSKKSPREVARTSKTATEEAERRNTLRYQFSANAEVVDIDSGVRLSARAADVSLGGCFLDTLIPLPIGSRVRMALFKGNAPLELTGKVTYSQQGLGMGIAFTNLSSEQKAVIQGWLAELNSPREPGYEVPIRRPTREEASDPDRGLLMRLIHLLIGKGILTEKEAYSLLRDPLP